VDNGTVRRWGTVRSYLTQDANVGKPRIYMCPASCSFMLDINGPEW
jgi:hypothetical protein